MKLIALAIISTSLIGAASVFASESERPPVQKVYCPQSIYVYNVANSQVVKYMMPDSQVLMDPKYTVFSKLPSNIPSTAGKPNGARNFYYQYNFKSAAVSSGLQGGVASCHYTFLNPVVNAGPVTLVSSRLLYTGNNSNWFYGTCNKANAVDCPLYKHLPIIPIK